MDFKKIQDLALEIKSVYKKKGYKWNVEDYFQGFVADVGELGKLLQIKKGLRKNKFSNINKEIEHEISDCLWSIIIIANELKIDLGKSFTRTMREIKEKEKA
jgi:NTP pyrophosphatase (non-canonical NTP hydrolase)